jgi:hypothetical protein
MARAQRLERLDLRRQDAEADYAETLVAALRRSAAGSWGLFDHNQDRAMRAAWKPTVTDLCDRGREIDAMREALGMAPYTLHAEFEASRGPVSTSAPGEPRQARAWLDRLGADPS